jgi:hypothetical protein
MKEDIGTNVLKKLTPQERVVLADMWESDIRPALEKLMGNRQLQIAQLVLNASSDHYYTVENRGRKNELTNLSNLLSQNLKNENNRRAKNNKSE